MKRTLKTLFAGFLLLLLVMAQPLRAQWTSNSATNTPVSVIVQNHANMHQTVSDGAGGTFVVWRDNRNTVFDQDGNQTGPDNFDIYAQYFNAAGVAQWTANGVPVSLASGVQTYPYLIADGNGGIIITWMDKRNGTDFDIYAQKLNAAGTAQWTANGASICTAVRGQGSLYGYGNEHGLDITTDGAGGAIIAWMDLRNNADEHHCSVYTQRISSAGTVQWTTNGVSVYNATGYTNYPPNYLEILTDGANGAFIVWADNRSGDTENQNLYVQRVNGSGTVQWTANGATVCDAANNQYGYGKSIVSDAAGGLIISFSDIRSGTWQIYAQRFNSSGVAQWTANGVAITNFTGNTEPRQYNRIISDGASGAIISWDDYRSGSWDIYAQRINASGAVQWTSNGVAVCNAANDQIFNMMTSDGNNGAIITWQDQRTNPWHIYAQRISNAGAVQWTANGVAIATANAQAGQQNPMISVIGSGGAVVVFEDDRQNIYYRSLWAQKVNGNGTLTVLSANADLSALSLSTGTLAPAFGAATTAYTATVGNATTGITVTPTKSNANATIQVQVNNGGYATVASGNASASLALNVGSNTVNVKVTAEDGTTIKTYTITVTRAALPVPPTITSVTPAVGTVGTTVTLAGTGFNTTASKNIVYFGATRATVTGTPTATSITITVPAGATHAPVTLLNTDVSLSCSSPGRFNPTFTPSKATIATADMATLVTTSIPAPMFAYQVVNGDFDGDGMSDLAFANRDAGLTVFRNTGTAGSPAFGGRQEYATSFQEPTQAAVADVDADGKLDVILSGGNLYGYGISVFLNTTTSAGNISFAASIPSTVAGGYIAFGDMDKDGKPDLVAWANDHVEVFRNTSSGPGNFSLGSAIATSSGSTNNYVACQPRIADIDGDGRMDIVCGNNLSMTVYLNNSSGSGNISFAAVSSYATTTNVYRTAVADFNGDGKPDIVTTSTYNTANSKMAVFQNNSTAGNLSFTKVEYDSYDPTELMVGDFNGDGKADLAVNSLTMTTFNTALGIYQNKSSAATVSFGERIAFGPVNTISCYFATSFDADGDGKPDVVTSNERSYSVFRNQSVVNVWTGATSSNWNTAGNWSANVVPTSTEEASIPGGTPNAPVITTAQSVADLSLGSGATLTTTNTMNVSGAVNNNGIISGTGTVVLNGAAPQTISGSGTVNNLTLSNAAGATIIGGKTSVAGTLTISAGILTTGSLLTIKSSAAGTGRVAAITGGGAISGNVEVERYATARVKVGSDPYKSLFLASPVTANINTAGWQQQIHITGGGVTGTCSGGVTVPSATFDATATGNPSMFTYNDANATNAKWVSIPTTNQNLVAATGYRVTVRGPRSLGCALIDGSPQTNVQAITLSATGVLNTGNVTLPAITGGQFQLSGNPYASPINFDQLATAQAANIEAKYWTYNPENAGGVYSVYNAGTLTNKPASYTNDNVIASGQGYLLLRKAAAGTAAITGFYTTGILSATAQTGLYRGTNGTGNYGWQQLLRLGLYQAGGADTARLDETVFRFAQSGVQKDVAGELDAAQISRGAQSLAAQKAGAWQSIQTRPVPTMTGDTIALSLTSNATGQYLLSISEQIDMAGVDVILRDKFLGTQQPIVFNQPVAVNVTSDPLSKGDGRFELIFRSSATLAAKFISVSGERTADKATVKFTAQEDGNVKAFSVERSADGSRFEQVASLRGSDRAGQFSYAAEDGSVNSAVVYYRIKANNANGTADYSQVIKLSSHQIIKLALSPNPAKDVVTLRAEGLSAKASIRFTDASGRVVLSQPLTITGSGTQQLNVSSLAQGIYQVQVVSESGETLSTQKLIKQ